MHATTIAHQANAKAQAENDGETWSSEDIAFVAEFTDTESDADLALALGRTLYALWAIQHRIANGDVCPSPTERRVAMKGAPLVGQALCEGCFTFVTPAGTCGCPD